LRKENEELKREVDRLKKEWEEDQVRSRLSNETERMNLKCEFKVKYDIVQKENVYLKDERKKVAA